MNRTAILLPALLLAGCFGPHAFEGHDAARERSAHDGVAVISLDTLYYRGKGMYLAHARDPATGRAELRTFSGTLLVSTADRYNAPGDSIDYVMEFPAVPGRLVVRAVDDDPAFGALIEGGVLVGDRVDPGALKRYAAAAGGVLRSYQITMHTRDSINAANAAARAREAAASGTAGSDTSGSGSQDGRAPVGCSAQLHNRGSNTVRIFIGGKPGYTTGTFDRIGGNTWGMTLNCGDRVWIVDDHDNGVTSTVVGNGVRYVQIGEDGRSIWTE
ncbi:MAG TPA: hypothetical protein VHI13_07715 [Candidatus Kapabacteria bacterium]|nr:hypothetical protein [Candidatus Kapabacteria bacterium]